MSRHCDIQDTIPKQFRVGGVAMEPFSLGHHLILKSLCLPFAGSPDADCGQDEIVIGAAVCGLPFRDSQAAIANGSLPKLIRRWRRRLFGFWPGLRPSMLDMEASFRDYLRDGYALPPVWRHASSGIQLTAPWELMLKTKLIAGGFSESEVLTGYLPARWYEYFSIIEWEAAAECENPKHWRKVFYTREDAELIGGANG